MTYQPFPSFSDSRYLSKLAYLLALPARIALGDCDESDERRVDGLRTRGTHDL